MAQIKIDDVVHHLDHEMRRALQDAINEVAPSAGIDVHALFHAFERGVYRHCSTWENVPDQYVRPR